MVKHTPAISWQQPTNCLSVFDHFVGLARKVLRIIPSASFSFMPCREIKKMQDIDFEGIELH